MVFSKVKYTLLKQMVLGISIREDGDVIKGLLIENNKGNVSTAEYLGSMDAIREFILAHPHIPVVISLDYSAILWQVLEAPIQNTDEAEKAFEELVPNGSKREFIIEYSENVIAVARKHFITTVLGELEIPKNQIVGLSLAPPAEVPLAAYKSQNQDVAKVKAGDYEFTFSDGLVLDLINTKSEEFDLGQEILRAEFVSAFIPVLNYLNDNTHQIVEEFLTENETQFLYKVIFTKALKPVLFCLLGIFLINTIIYFQVSEKNNILKEQSAYVQQLDKQLKQVNQFLDSKKPVLDQLNRTAYYSMLSDQVGYHTLSGITLSRLTINPPSTQRGSESAFRKGILIIEGTASGGRVFQRWLERLRAQKWVSKISNQNYEKQSRDDGSKFQLIVTTDVQ